MEYFRKIYICLLFSIPTILWGLSDTTSLNSNTQEYFLRNASILEDSNSIFTPSSILSAKANSFFKHGELTNNRVKSTYWLRFTLHNSSPIYDRWVMEYVDPHIGNVEVFEKVGDSLVPIFHAGFANDFSKKLYQHKNFILEADFNQAPYKTYYTRIQSESQNSFMVVVRKSNKSMDYALREYYLLGVFFGVLLVMALYNLFLYFSIRENTYLYYVAYIISCAFTSFSEDGIGFQYFWPTVPALNMLISVWNPIFFMLIFVIYSGSFLRLNERLPKWNIAIWISAGVYLIVFLAQRFFVESPKVYMPLYLVPFIIIYLAGIYSTIKGRKAARYFVLAYSFILISIAITILRTKGFGNLGFIGVYSFNFGFFLEVLILSYAMSERFKEEKLRREAAQKEIIRQLQEREKYQEKLNRELEIRVQERTSELAEANDEITRINELLSQHNLELMEDVKQISLERITQQEMSFEEFSKIYPDDKACYDYLATLKWQNGYTCKKCGNDKFNPIASHSRRCNKCKYIESVTAFTIFHSIKFPIQHAFYLLFIINLRKDIKVEELATMVPLSEKSCGSFKRKVMAAEKSVRGRSKGGWERLIFYYEKED